MADQNKAAATVPPALRRFVRACRDCGLPILWTLTEAGHRLAVDPRPDPAGNQAINRDGAGTFRSRVPSDELPAAAYERVHMPHAATCKRGQAAERAARRTGIAQGDVIDLRDARKRRDHG